MKFTTIASVLVAAAAVYAEPLSVSEVAAKAAEGLRLLRFSPDSDPVWVTEDEKLEVMRNYTRFVSPVTTLLTSMKLINI